MLDPFHLRRFVDVQEGVYPAVVRELKAGRKRSHWMWYIFPQLAGLGSSAMARKYAISSGDEARAYSSHPVLGARLRECTGLVLAVEGRAIDQIFGFPDHLKFQSCMTLFAHCAADATLFHAALEEYFAGKADQCTLRALSSPPGRGTPQSRSGLRAVR